MDLFEQRINEFNIRKGSEINPIIREAQYVAQLNGFNNMASFDKFKPAIKANTDMLDPVFKSKTKKPKLDIDNIPVEIIMDTIIKEKPSVIITRKLLKKYVNELSNILDGMD